MSRFVRRLFKPALVSLGVGIVFHGCTNHTITIDEATTSYRKFHFPGASASGETLDQESSPFEKKLMAPHKLQPLPPLPALPSLPPIPPLPPRTEDYFAVYMQQSQFDATGHPDVPGRNLKQKEPVLEEAVDCWSQP
ncbi:Hypothetical protein POVN_LOCUS646 [uncultured virus]|nr:Hypothetical protein POVN_LOCUS646 [uncultured virus]